MNKDEISLNLQRLSHMETILSKLMPSMSLDLPSLEAKIAELSESLQTYPDKVLTDIELGSYQQVTLNETQTYYEDAGSNESFVARVHEIICQGREFQVQHKLTNVCIDGFIYFISYPCYVVGHHRFYCSLLTRFSQ